MEDDHDGDGADSPSHFRRSVILRDWWLIKCANEFEGKRFGVAGIEDVESRVMRVFTSSPIIKVFDVFTLQASDGIYVTLQGFLNKERVVQNGFSLEISREFVFGFPPSWEKLCNDWFQREEESGSDIKFDKGCNTILSPCENKKDNVKDSSAENEENKDGFIGGSRAGDEKTVRRKSLRVRSNCAAKSVEVERKLEFSEVQNTSEDGDHGGEGLNNDESGEGVVEEKQVQNRMHDGAHCGGGLDQANENEVILPEAIENEVVLPEDGCGKEHTGTDNVDNVTSTNATEESLISEQRIEELEVTGAALPSDSHKSSKPGRKAKKSLKRDGNLVELNNHSGSKVGDAENEIDVSKVQNSANERDQGSESLNKASENPIRESLTSEQPKGKPTTHSLVEGLDNNSKPKKRGRPKKGTKSHKSDGNLGEPNNHSGSKVGCAENGIDVSKVQNSTNERDQGGESLNKASENPIRVSLASEQLKGKDSDNNSKSRKRGRPKKSEKTPKSNRKVIEPINHSGSKGKEAKETLSWEKTRRKIDFDVEVSPEKKAKKQMAVFDFEVKPQKEAKKQETNADCSGSVGQRRSRSGRKLVSPLDFWRNQVPVYDKDRKIVQVKEGSETPGKGSATEKAKKMKTK